MTKRLNIEIKATHSLAPNQVVDQVKGVVGHHNLTLTGPDAHGVIRLNIEATDQEIDRCLTLLGEALPKGCDITYFVEKEDVDAPIKGVLTIDDTLAIFPSDFSQKGGPRKEAHHTFPIEITIDCHDSFGHGGHPSTLGMLKALLRLTKGGLIADRSVLDVGTGSGVLAIAALKLGANSVVGIDIDVASIKEASKNAHINQCPPERLRFLLASCKDFPLDGFDLVLANIVPGVRREFLSNRGLCHMPQDGIVLISGGKIGDNDYIDQMEKHLGFKCIDRIKVRGWLTTCFRRR